MDSLKPYTQLLPENTVVQASFKGLVGTVQRYIVTHLPQWIYLDVGLWLVFKISFGFEQMPNLEITKVGVSDIKVFN